MGSKEELAYSWTAISTRSGLIPPVGCDDLPPRKDIL